MVYNGNGINPKQDKEETMRFTVPATLRKAKIRIGNIKKSEVDEVFGIPSGRWEYHFPRDADVRCLVNDFRDEISRAKVVNYAPKTQTPTFSQLRRFFIAAMMWGYGERERYGPWRTRAMLDNPATKKALPNAYRHILDGDLQAAVDAVSGIKWFASTRFSKFFYFVGCAHKTRPMPLILDTYVLDELQRRQPTLAKEVATPQYKDNSDVVASFRPLKGGYALYVKEANDWARELGVKPDRLEFFLFDTNRKRRP